MSSWIWRCTNLVYLFIYLFIYLFNSVYRFRVVFQACLNVLFRDMANAQARLMSAMLMST